MIHHNTFLNNIAREGLGGAICIFGDNLLISDNYFENNYAGNLDGWYTLPLSHWGGGVLSKGLLTLDSCEFKNNHADQWGGAVYADSELVMRNCNFTGNYARGIANNTWIDYKSDRDDSNVNTTVNYIHYTLQLPNDDVQLKLSGNYVVLIARDGDFENGVVATACFSLVEPMVDINVEMNGRTMKELNGRYQAVALDVMVEGVESRDKMQDFIVVVRQNNRLDNEAYLTRPTYVNGGRLRYENREELIFAVISRIWFFSCSSPEFSAVSTFLME